MKTKIRIRNLMEELEGRSKTFGRCSEKGRGVSKFERGWLKKGLESDGRN